MKKLIALIASIGLVLTVLAPVSAADRFELDSIAMTPGDVMFQVVESDILQGYSQIESSPKDQSNLTDEQRRNSFKTCTSLADPNCAISNTANNIGATSVFPICSSGITDVCVESLAISVAGAAAIPATFVKMANNGMTVKGSQQHNLLAGDGSSVFEYKNAVTGLTDTYVATVKAHQQFNRSTNKFGIYALNATVLPVRVEKDAKYSAVGNGATNGCVYFEPGECGIAQEYGDDVSVKLTFRTPSNVGGWFRGRMQKPQIAISSVNSKVNRITVEAQPVSVPKLGVTRTISKLAGQEKIWYDTYAKWGTKAGLGAGMDASQKAAFDFIEGMRAEAKDTITGSGKSWFLTTIDASRSGKCLSDTSKVQGIVTTNSLVYDPGAPTFQGGFLNYKVGGMHFETDGKTAIQGSYDLVIRSETARCLYGFSNAPLSATVSVTGGSEKNVATTVVSEKNGWLKMAAYGFTFSNKTIKVKITKKKKK